MHHSVANKFRPLRRMQFGAFLALFLLVACVPPKPDPSRAPRSDTASDLPAISATDMPPNVATPPAQAAPTKSSTATARPSVPASPPPASVAATKAATTRVAKTDPPQIDVPSKPTTVGASAPAIAKQSSAVIPADKSSPTLNLAALEQRLRDTRAIGVFAKLSLKNQVDDLLDEFRDFYRGTLKTQLTALRQRYDLLMMKVLTLLQDSDTALAASIRTSREAIWNILKDPQQFSQIRSG